MGNRLAYRAFQLIAAHPRPEAYFKQPNAEPNAIVIRDMRCTFSVERSSGSDPNKADIIISNLDKATRDDIVRTPCTIELAAGYDNEARHIFTGDVRFGYTDPTTAKVETRIALADGERAWRYARVNRSYPPGTDVKTVLRDAARSMQVALPPNIESSLELREQFATGFSAFGATRDELTRLLAPYGYTWSIQNGQLQILKDEQVRSSQAWLIDASKGLIGSPTWSVPTQPGEKPKLTMRVLLYPELYPASLINVVSEDVTGLFKVEKVTHTGDTHGEDWTTTIECKPTAGKVLS